MSLEHLLVAVQGKLLAAHGADLPVALHVLLELVLIVVGREDDLAERAALHVHAAETWGGGSSKVMSAHVKHTLIKSICLMRRGWPPSSTAAEQTLHTCYNTPQRQQTWAPLMRLSVTWDQSRRRSDHR